MWSVPTFILVSEWQLTMQNSFIIVKAAHFVNSYDYYYYYHYYYYIIIIVY